MIAISLTFNNLDLIVDPLQGPGMNGVVTVIEDSISIAAKHLSEPGDLRMTQGSGQRTPLVKGFISPRAGSIGPDVFKLVFKDQDSINHFVQFQEPLQVFSVFGTSNPGSVFQQEIFAPFEDLFVGFGGSSVFGISHLVDDAVELGHHMKQVENDFHMGDFLLDGQDKGVPHIHHHGLQGLSLLSAHAREEFLQGPSFAVFSHPDHSPRQVVQDHGQVAMAFSDRDLVDRQDSESLVVGLGILSLQKPLVDRFDCFPIQPQMVGHFLEGHDLAEFVNIASHPFGHSEIGIEEIEVLDGKALTFGAKDLAVMALDPDPGRGEVEVPKRSLFLAVDSYPFASTEMADGVEAFVGHDFDPGPLGIFRNPLLHNSDFWKGEIVCYTEIGHRWPPLGNFLDTIQVYYPLEIPDVQFFFAALT